MIKNFALALAVTALSLSFRIDVVPLAQAQDDQPESHCRDIFGVGRGEPAEGTEIAETLRDTTLRRGPGYACRVFDYVPAGGTVEVVGCRKTWHGSWCGISYGTLGGYVPARSLEPLPHAVTPFD
jgi:hypothetical protein